MFLNLVFEEGSEPPQLLPPLIFFSFPCQKSRVPWSRFTQRMAALALIQDRTLISQLVDFLSFMTQGSI